MELINDDCRTTVIVITSLAAETKTRTLIYITDELHLCKL